MQCILLGSIIIFVSQAQVAKYLKTNSLFIVNGSTWGPTKIAKPTVFQVVLRGIGKSFQSAITAPRINLTGYGNATAQS